MLHLSASFDSGWTLRGVRVVGGPLSQKAPLSAFQIPQLVLYAILIGFKKLHFNAYPVFMWVASAETASSFGSWSDVLPTDSVPGFERSSKFCGGRH